MIHCYMTMDQQLTLISHQKSSISSVNRWLQHEATVKRPRVELCRANSAASIATTCPSLTSISRGTAVSWAKSLSIFCSGNYTYWCVLRSY